MMDRLLALKKSISEYFRQHTQNTRKLTSHKWTVTNEVCSLLDDVSEATIRMQGAADTHVNQEDMGVGKGSLKMERLCALLDPRWKALGADSS